MNHLLRSSAPISDAGWDMLDREARERLLPALAARKLVDFTGPLGWEHSATNLGRTSPLAVAPGDGVSGLQRRVLALVEARADFELSRAELRDADRGADGIDLGSLDRAAHQIAVAENIAVFHGWPGAITGISEASPHEQIKLGKAAERYPIQIAVAAERLLSSGIAGRSSRARSSGRQVSMGQSCSACEAATSSSSPARTIRLVTTRTTARWCGCISNRASASTSRRPRLR